MKLILSRKGFDAKYGGSASPIFEDESMLSLPIPRPSHLSYAAIRYRGASLAADVTSLSRGRIGGAATAHLDPDLRREAIVRARRWRPIFGQAGAAQSHLANCGVGPGDLFLFFGWFRRVERAGGKLRYVRGAPDLHVVFGWMQIGELHPVTQKLAEEMPWAAYHPHLSDGWDLKNNTIYVASERLSTLGLEIPGAGAFECFRPELCLTHTEPYRGRSTWRLPRWFRYPRGAALSRHGAAERWRGRRDHVELRTVPIGQEFVLDLDLREYPQAREWLTHLIAGADATAAAEATDASTAPKSSRRKIC
ncbi:MAG TPA: hypothetical protein VIX59_15825 [Candidatus Binataceae bacterium]